MKYFKISTFLSNLDSIHTLQLKFIATFDCHSIKTYTKFIKSHHTKNINNQLYSHNNFIDERRSALDTSENYYIWCGYIWPGFNYYCYHTHIHTSHKNFYTNNGISSIYHVNAELCQFCEQLLWMISSWQRKDKTELRLI